MDEPHMHKVRTHEYQQIRLKDSDFSFPDFLFSYNKEEKCVNVFSGFSGNTNRDTNILFDFFRILTQITLSTLI